MKKVFYAVTTSIVTLSIVFASFSFITPAAIDVLKVSAENPGMIEFRITNDTGSEFKYCVNGGHNYINKGSTKVFNYSEGQEFFYVEGSNCGKKWFKVTSSMAGKTFKVSELKS